ncbi:MAG: hypothetical protein ACJ72X_03000 [Nitrososphaeraceae archaeon]
MLLQKIRNESSFSSSFSGSQKDNGYMEKLDELDEHFMPSKEERVLLLFYWCKFTLHIIIIPSKCVVNSTSIL